MSRQRKHINAPPRAPLSPFKRRIFLAITIALPFIVILCCELTLRAIHYGPDLSLITTQLLNGHTYHIMNPAVKGRYFTRVVFSPTTSPDYFVVPKPPETFRIFCLGGSTTVGYPYWYNGSFSSFLRDRLRRVFPAKNIEIINVGMTATNSFTVNDMARELVDYEPDLFIDYDGHNEFYGALGVASTESLGGNRWIATTYLRLLRFRTFLLVRNLYESIAGIFHQTSDIEQRGTMMEKLAFGKYIPFNSPTYRNGLSMFRGNLEDLKEIATSHGIPLIVGTQVSNLRGQPPFISGDTPGKTPDERLRFNERFNAALGAWMDGHFTDALAGFRASSTVDSTRAETHFQIARCLDAVGRKAEARREYVLARDYDQLRFRTSSDFNTALRHMDNGSTVATADIEQVFQDLAPDSLIGNDLILEHLHPNSRGYFIIAREYARTMRRMGILAPASEWARRDTVSDDRLWEDRPVTEIDERTAQRRTEVLRSGWPFTSQFPEVNAVAKNDTLGQIAEKLTRAQINWNDAHEEAAEHYLDRHEDLKAEREYRVIINQLPGVDVRPYLYLARVLLNGGKTNEVQSVLQSSLQVQPTILAYRALADIAMNNRAPKDAAGYYEKTFSFPQSPQEQAENGYLLGLAFFRAGEYDRARERLLKVLTLRPDYPTARQLLQVIENLKKP